MNEEADKLVVMANRIAANLAPYADAPTRTADHLRRFWAPSMRRTLLAHVAAGGTGLSDLARSAAAELDRTGGAA
ncbi:MAG: formate dehydrogenase subunit delta [Pseudomonadota bacterium]